MIVVDTSVFVDLFFEYDRNRTRLAEQFFENVNDAPLFEPELFKIELISQLVRKFQVKNARDFGIRRFISSKVKRLLMRLQNCSGDDDNAPRWSRRCRDDGPAPRQGLLRAGQRGEG
ncbi:PIN domain-containing protein [Thermococcus guaymasensis]|uniref:PIN domain-containing protein n=1 Tax=Thermococcus guaymasensis TaxID=110164 RepID=UPI0009FCF125|nr:PIN domain-containing protein [Thermococcus guaymasensis]